MTYSEAMDIVHQKLGYVRCVSILDPSGSGQEVHAIQNPQGFLLTPFRSTAKEAWLEAARNIQEDQIRIWELQTNSLTE